MTESNAPLRRVLGVWTVAALIVGTVIGSGIFLVPADMINAVGSPGMVFFVWIFGGILSLFGALTYAELGAAMPEAGGEYVYLKAAYGPFLAFIQGWMNTTVGFSASIAAKAAALYTYTADFIPALNHVLFSVPLPIGPGGGPLEIREGQIFGIAMILLLGVLNYVGVRVGGGIQVATTALKIGMIAAIVLLGLASTGSAAHFAGTTLKFQGGIAGFFTALVAALWAYDGWNNAGMIGADVKDPGRNMPRVLILGTGAVICIYLLTNLAYFLVLSPAEVGATQRVAGEAMRRVLGPSGGAVVSAAAILSIFASLNGSLLAGSRVPFAMARSGLFFRPMGRLHPKYGTPGPSLCLLVVWGSVLLLSGRFEDLYRLVIFTEWIFYALTAVGVILLRRRQPDLPRPYRVLGYPWVPIVFVLVALGLLLSTLLTYPRESGIGLALIVLGLPFYFHWNKRGNPASAISSSS